MGPPLTLLWLAGLAAVGMLMWCGVLGMSYVEFCCGTGCHALILAVVGMVFAFPLAILLALGRRSGSAVRAVCAAYIELCARALITVLFMASVMPAVLPTGMTIDKLLRAQVAFILFSAAYLPKLFASGSRQSPRARSKPPMPWVSGFGCAPASSYCRRLLRW